MESRMSSEQTYSRMKRFVPIFLAAVCLIPLFFNSGCANTKEAPTGGPKDSIPPFIIDIKPLPGAVNVPVKDARFIFTFNEYVSIKEAKNIFLSPPMKKTPKSKIKGKSLIVWFEEDLAPETTYTLNLDDAIADVNENNIFPGYSYVFSTGSHIDSMAITGTVLDCEDLKPVKGATVMLYKDHADSAIFLHRPYAAAKTDDWGFFSIPFIQDTLFRLYAILEETPDNIYQPEQDKIAFFDSLVRPTLVTSDTLKELMKYDMKDTLGCKARKSQYQMLMFKERPTKQMIVNRARVADRAAYVTFMAPFAYLDSLWIRGYKPTEIISQFNVKQDSLEIWINDRRTPPDSLELSISYRKTDSLGALVPSLEKFKMAVDTKKYRSLSHLRPRELKLEDTTCLFKITASPEKVEQDGYLFEFNLPIISQRFKDIKLKVVNSRQQEKFSKFTVEQDSTNLRQFILRPSEKMMVGNEYILKVPHECFRDINGHWSDSTEVKLSLPKDDKLSKLEIQLTQVKGKLIVDLMDDKKASVIRSYIINKNCKLTFPYLKAGKYSIRVTCDDNENSIVDSGNLLEHRQPEKVRYYIQNGKDFIEIPESSDVLQTIDIKEQLK